MSPNACSRSPATRTMKNSSRFDAKIARNFTRSKSGLFASSASSSTRALNSNQLNSRLMKCSGRKVGGTVLTGQFYHAAGVPDDRQKRQARSAFEGCIFGFPGGSTVLRTIPPAAFCAARPGCSMTYLLVGAVRAQSTMVVHWRRLVFGFVVGVNRWAKTGYGQQRVANAASTVAVV